MSDIDTGVVDSLKALDPDGRLEKRTKSTIANILAHPEFREWIKDPTMPKYFRDAGHFWGIAAGTPPSVIRRRIAEIDHTVEKSRATLDQSGRDEVASRHGLTLFSRADLDRVAELQATLKLRFLTG